MKPHEPLVRSNPASDVHAGPGDAAAAVPDDDAPLVAAARARDQEAFRMLVDRHRDRAHAVALRIVHSHADAQEVTQDAFVRAWLALPQFRGESRFGTWLHRIVARRALDRAAVLERRRGREAQVEAAESIPAATREPSTPEALRMEALVAELSDAQRAVVTLFYYEGYGVDQVASILGMPPGTVKTHLSRARAALRERWPKSGSAST